MNKILIYCLFFCLCFRNKKFLKSTESLKSKEKKLLNVGKFRLARKIFQFLKLKLLHLLDLEMTLDCSFDYITTWQLTALSLCSLYSNILNVFSNKYYFINEEGCNKNGNGYGYGNGNGNEIKNDGKNIIENNEIFLSILLDYYMIFHSILEVLNVRIRHTRWTFTSDYFSSLSSMSQEISNIEDSSHISILLALTTKCSADIQDIKKRISGILLSIARQVRDSGDSHS